MSEGSRLQPWATPPSLVSLPEGMGTGGGRRVPRTSSPIPGSAPAMSTAPRMTGSQMIPPVRWVKPPRAVDFNMGGTLSAADVATTTPFGTLATYTSPAGNVSFLRSLDVQVNGLLPTSDIRFLLTIDGAPLVGWNDLVVLPASLAVYARSWLPEELFIRVEPSKTLGIAVQVRDAGAYDVGATAHGWTVGQELADASDAGWG